MSILDINFLFLKVTPLTQIYDIWQSIIFSANIKTQALSHMNS